MHWLSNSWNNSDNLPFHAALFLFSAFMWVSISIAHSFQLTDTWTFLVWGFSGEFFFSAFSLFFFHKIELGSSTYTYYFDISVFSLFFFPSNASIFQIFVELFLQKTLYCIFPLGSWCYCKKIGAATNGDMKYISICLNTVQTVI